MRKRCCLIFILACAVTSGLFAQAKKPAGCISKDPYIGAIVIDAGTGKPLFEDKADIPGYPASTLKLMTLLIIQEKISAGSMKLTDMVGVSKKAAATGGSQVYLDPRETFSVEDMLYALMIQSANDVAVALTEHVAGSTEAFVALMNAKAHQLGMVNTRFASVHGLPPGPGQTHDVSTARDLAILCRELCTHPAVFAYTSTDYRQLRADTKPFDMRTHNPFLKAKTRIAGCDGFKTGYTATAGYSIAVTCKRNDRRIIVVVLGSDTLKTRDAKAKELLEQAFSVSP
ncbi:MAG: D-alanyl-D-alanine carboxypeptidase [Kiritimatiellaeota bacterium]|nr:D-alanyl-D-alanine carboxypeptidase [Kiritimatiellota bacterium]